MITEPTQPPPLPEPSEGTSLFDYRRLREDAGYVLRAPFRHRRLAVASILFVVLVAASSILVLRDVYQVQAVILALRNPVMSTLSNPGLARGGDWDAPTRAARETVLRRDNLVALCEQTGFVDRFLKERSPLGRFRARLMETLTGQKATREELTEALADTLQNRLWVTVAPEGTVAITFEWRDPDTAYQIVEAAVQNFLEARHASEIAVLGETVALLEGRAATLQKELDSTLAELERRGRTRPRAGAKRVVTWTPGTTTHRTEDMARLESTLSARRRALADLDDFRQRRVAELQAQLAQKEATYAERHPEVVNTRQNIAAFSQPSPQVEALRAEVRELERQVSQRGGRVGGGALANPTPALPTEILEPRSGVESEDLRYEYDRGQLRLLFDQYSAIRGRIAAAAIELETAQAAFKYKYSVISPPMIPKGPVKSYTLLRLAAGILGGIGLALFTTTAVDIWSNRILERWQIERSLGLPVLAEFHR